MSHVSILKLMYCSTHSLCYLGAVDLILAVPRMLSAFTHGGSATVRVSLVTGVMCVALGSRALVWRGTGSDDNEGCVGMRHSLLID